jgi:putative endonuclease
MQHAIYMLICQGGGLYTGYTTDLARRCQEHLSGSIKCKYTRSFPPIALACAWIVEAERGWVLRCEKAIKRLSKPQKQALVRKPEQLLEQVSLSAPKQLVAVSEAELKEIWSSLCN